MLTDANEGFDSPRGTAARIWGMSALFLLLTVILPSTVFISASSRSMDRLDALMNTVDGRITVSSRNRADMPHMRAAVPRGLSKPSFASVSMFFQSLTVQAERTGIAATSSWRASVILPEQTPHFGLWP